ncbi:MAG: DUF1015 domain-containing protein [Deltaproteobacteria bacterium]|nr:DUF1015 domain-containing protein [Deltaproteobacteria bacterium]
MARFRPLRGIRYSPSRVGALGGVVAPPYDVISPAQRDGFYDASPFNCTRLILNKEGHDEAARQYRAWLDEGVLIRDQAPTFYLYSQDFEAGGPRRRIGVLGALALEPYSTGVVLRHENTFAHHKRDRLELTKRVKANLSPIFCVYSKPGFVPEPDGGWDAKPEIDVMLQGVRHRVWGVRSAQGVETIRAAVADQALFIADGHHRYETALNYYYECVSGGAEPPQGDDAPDDDGAPAAHVLAFLATFEDPGMVILPTHRELVASGGADAIALERALAESFKLERFAGDAAGIEALLSALAGAGKDTHAFAIAMRGLPHLLLATRAVSHDSGSSLRELDVTVLHDDILGRALSAAGGKENKLAYSIDPRAVIARVRLGELEGAFVMNATRSEQMAKVCRAGELMPQKSTYFYPKLLTGLVFHALE